MFVNIATPSIWFLAFVAATTIFQCTGLSTGASFSAAQRAKRDNQPVVITVPEYDGILPFGGTPAGLLDPKSGFLAGEDTPVWLASRTPDKPVTYTKLEKGIVKKAIDHWKSKQTNTRGRRSIHGNGNITRSTRDAEPEYIYPSVLAMMDYGDTWPKDEAKQQEWIKEKILYALAFWNGVDLQLRYIDFPAVRIRLAGIILGQTSTATPYISENVAETCLGSDYLIVPMMAYWRRLAIKNNDFNTRAYDIIATMTSTTRCGSQSDYTEPAAATSRRICSKNWKGINGILVHDDLSFRGIQAAVHAMAVTLGAKRRDSCPLVKDDVMEESDGTLDGGYGRKWAPCTLQDISSNLFAHGSCMQSPQEYHSPGNPVETILPGKLIPVKDQCQTYLDNRKPFDCFESMRQSPCGELFCTADTTERGTCSRTGQLVADGSTCDVGYSGNGAKICLDGECVPDPTLA